ncbi:hypothetical protein FACS1894137_12910 [Spirochaetia bacterium]|nr:hypothetical protein FACS1894137_12910 [Spirochaetia bacterium]
MKIVHDRINSPGVLVRELPAVNGGVMLTTLILDGEVSGGRLHPLIVNLSDESFSKALIKAHEETADGFGSVPFGILIEKDELKNSPHPLYEHDLLLWFV